MDGYGIGVTIGIALVGVGMLVAKVYGSRAERRFNRILYGGLFGVIALLLVVGLIWCAIASDC